MKIEVDVYIKGTRSILHEFLDDFDLLMMMQRRIADRNSDMIVEDVQIAKIEP